MSETTRHCSWPACRGVVVSGVLVTISIVAGAVHAQLPRISLSADGRSLLKGDKPFLWMGDTAWRITRLSVAEMDVYLANRRAKGFNVIQGPVLHSDAPDREGNTNPSASEPNEAWFAIIDEVIARCAAHGLYVAPVLTWGSHAPEFTADSAFAYGQYVGQRYRMHSNIAAFIVAGEFNHPVSNVPIWTAMAQGLLAGLDGAPALLTALPRWYGVNGGQSSSYSLHAQRWLSLNMHQSSSFGDCSNDPTQLYYMGTHNWLLAEHDWPLAPVKPFLDAEATYEQQNPNSGTCQFNPNRWPAFGVRRRAYWSIFAGAAGHTYGANGVYQFYRLGDVNVGGAPNAYWTLAIDFPGAQQMAHLHRLLRSRPAATRVPAQEMLLSGATELVPTHIQALRAADGAFAMVYVPETAKVMTLDMDLISGRAHRFWWFEPATGQATLIGERVRGEYGSDGEFDLITPASGEDWVLVVDDIARDFAAPGAATLWTPGDINGDERVNTDDLLLLVGSWGPCAAPPPAPCPADLQTDGVVNTDDLLQVIGGWGG